MIEIKKGDVFLVNLDPTIGNEINKTRPALVVSNDIGNANSSIISVSPISSKIDKIYPFEVLIDNLKLKSKALIDHTRAIDKRRLVKHLATVSKNKLAEVDRALKLVYDLE